MVRYWNSLIGLEDNRLTKKIFKWDMDQRSNSWASEVKQIFDQVGLIEKYNSLNPCPTEQIWASLHESKCQEWSDNLSNYPKLRTYVLFKSNYCIEPYVYINMNRKYRSAIAQLRSGILPLEIEVGRWKGLDPEQRLCKFCDTQAVEDEYHFVFECSLYHEERSIYTDKLGVEKL